MHIIGIGGLKRSGKDTFARVVADVARKDGIAVAVIAFADAVRRAAAAAYGVDAAVFTDDARKDTICEAWGITYRQMLINLGEAMRSVDVDHWVKAWRQSVAAVRPTYWGPDDDGPVTKQLPTLVLVPDLRRVNEAEAIHNAGGMTVLMRRPGVEWNGHETEVLAHLAQHRDDFKAASLNCVYAKGVPFDSTGKESRSLSYLTPSLPWRYIYDTAIDNPVAVGVQATEDDTAKLRLSAVEVLIDATGRR